MTQAAVIGVDWGTSSLRVWALDRQGAVLAEARSGQGMATLQPGDYEVVLEEKLAGMSVPATVPVLVCGMAGAAKGWREAAYLDVPADVTTLAGAALRVETAQRDVRILPGLAKRDPSAPDVIRGEETILLGAIGEEALSGLVCLPGTHSKWVRIEGGAIVDFATSVTGELYALLASHSTLSHFLPSEEGADFEKAAFAAAVREALADPAAILSRLFSIRSMPLLQGPAAAADMRARLSGLLIGLEIAGQGGNGPVTLIASGASAETYKRAFSLAGIESRCLDAALLVRSGLLDAARRIWPDLSD